MTWKTWYVKIHNIVSSIADSCTEVGQFEFDARYELLVKLHKYWQIRQEVVLFTLICGQKIQAAAETDPKTLQTHTAAHFMGANYLKKRKEMLSTVHKQEANLAEQDKTRIIALERRNKTWILEDNQVERQNLKAKVNYKAAWIVICLFENISFLLCTYAIFAWK